MAAIIPFRAVRPTRDKVCLVTCRSYEEYVNAELAAQLDFNPLSFLHILQPAYSSQQSIAYEKRYKQVHQRYEEFKHEGILVKDPVPTVYIHRIVNKNQTFTGIVAATSLEDYKNNLIKKHEETIAFRVRLLKEYMHYSGFNTEPVLITYPDNDTIEQWIAEKTKKLSDFEFSTTKRETNYLWKIDNAAEIEWLQFAFKKIDHLYIADGHHRFNAALLLSEENTDKANTTKDYILSYLISESNIKIYEYNRLIKDLHGLNKEEFLKKIKVHFFVENKGSALFLPREKHQFGMYLDGEFYALYLKVENCNFNSPLDNLDPHILYEKVLLPILGISDLRNDERIDYIPGKQSVLEVKNQIDSGEFKVGFMLFPSTIDDIKTLSDAEQIMPPKSTYIEPKFRSGLVVYEFTQ